MSGTGMPQNNNRWCPETFALASYLLLHLKENILCCNITNSKQEQIAV